MAVEPLDVIETVVRMRQAGQVILNVYQHIHAGSASVTEAAVLVALRTWLEGIYTVFDNNLANDLVWEGYDSRNITRGTPVGSAAFALLTVGGSATQAEPLQVAAVVRFPTDYSGSQLRKFVPGMTTGRLDENGILTAAAQADILAGFATCLTPMSVSGESFVYGRDNPAEARFAAAQSVVVNDVVGTQRRRKQGVGL